MDREIARKKQLLKFFVARGNDFVFQAVKEKKHNNKYITHRLKDTIIRRQEIMKVNVLAMSQLLIDKQANYQYPSSYKCS